MYENVNTTSAVVLVVRARKSEGDIRLGTVNRTNVGALRQLARSDRIPRRRRGVARPTDRKEARAPAVPLGESRVAQRSLNEATISGVRWLALTRVVSEGLAFGAAVALARLVTPAEFGHAAVALIFVPLAAILTFEGFASALVQRAEITDADKRSAMFMSLVGGVALSAAVLALGRPVWRPLFGAQTASLIGLMSPVLLISAVGAVSRAVLLRQMQWPRISMIDLASLLVASAVAVVLAAQGMQARAIIIGALAQASTTTLLLIGAVRPPRPRWSAHAQHQLRGFGIPAALAGLVDVLFRNVDYAILAARLSAVHTGWYYRAFNLGVVYQDKLSRIMMQLAFPVYSRTRDHAELRRLHERAARVHAVVIFPLLTSLIVLAPLLIPLVFGPAWTGSILPTEILAVAGMIAAVLTGYPQVMLAVGKPRALLFFNLGVLATYASAIMLAAGHGLVVVAITVVAVYSLILVGAYRLLLQRYVGISIGRLIPELGPALTGCLALAAVTEPLRRVAESVLPRVIVIAGVGTIGLAVYVVVLRAVFPDAWNDVRVLAVRVAPQLSQLRRRSTSRGMPRGVKPEAQPVPLQPIPLQPIPREPVPSD